MHLEPPVDLLRLRGAAFASAIDGIFVTDPTRPDNPTVDVTAAFGRMTGYGRDEVPGRGCSHLR
jgi:PAS domain-containing protein